MNKIVYRYLSFLAFTILTFSLGCNPTYQSIRAYVPQHTKENQLQAEIGPSQVDVSYSITDQLQVNAGGVYLTNKTEEKGSDIDGNEVKNTETSDLMGAQIGVGYFKALGEDKDYVISLNVGSAFQSWNFNRTNTELIGNTGFDSFEASIINPHAQLGFSHGNQSNNILLGVRYEKPMIDFQKLIPSDATDESNPELINFIIQGKLPLTYGLSLFGQFIYRENLNQEYFDNDTTYNEYSISSWNIYAGLGYAIDFAK